MKPSVCPSLTAETLETPVHIEHDGVLLCTALILQPVFKGEAPKWALRRINSYYERFAKKLLRYVNTVLAENAMSDYEYRSENGFPFFPYELRSDFTVTLNKEGFLSLYTDVYEFTGGAHGNTRRFADIWHSDSGFPASVSDFFPRGANYKRLLTDEATAEAARQMEEGTFMYFDNYPELIKKNFSKQNIYLTESGMALFFQQYEIAPYSSGIPVFVAAYNSETGPFPPECRNTLTPRPLYRR